MVFGGGYPHAADDIDIVSRAIEDEATAQPRPPFDHELNDKLRTMQKQIDTNHKIITAFEAPLDAEITKTDAKYELRAAAGKMELKCSQKPSKRRALLPLSLSKKSSKMEARAEQNGSKRQPTTTTENWWGGERGHGCGLGLGVRQAQHTARTRKTRQ